MVFSSQIFLFLFFPITLMLYYICRLELRNIVLLLASLFFYAWGEPKYIFLILTLIFANYVLGIAIERNHLLGWKRFFLVLTLVIDFGSLIYYKYFNFLIENANALFHLSITAKEILLPLGISFFIFQIVSYVIDVYWGNVKAQRNILHLALYISLFPQLIAGPIVRYIDVEDQIQTREHSLDKFYDGCKLFMTGFSKKVLIADQVASIADLAFASTNLTFSLAWVGIIAYSLQIYFDFSGYSDMARGIGKMFGFDFMVNFNYPYIAKSIREFWKRWHISLSTWFRDYVYIPLGGSRCKKSRVIFNTSVVWLFTGFWHGASWNFIVWGLWYLVFLLLEREFLGKKLDKLPAAVGHVYALLIITIGWVFFRAVDLTHAIQYLSVMFSFDFVHSMELGLALTKEKVFFITAGIIFSTPILGWVKEKVLKNNELISSTVLLCTFAIAVLYMVGSGFSPFLYFRF